MKVKSDFVTNSSSASYIMRVKPKDNDMTLEEFFTTLNAWIEIYKRRYPNSVRFWSASDIVEESIDGGPMFSITEWTSMHNGAEDIPHYMKVLMIEKFVNEYNLDFTVESFDVIDDH